MAAAPDTPRSIASSSQIEPERISTLVDDEPADDGRYVLYWMQAAQRAEHNPALEYAVQRANHHGVPLVVAVIVVPDYPEASARHFAFMLDGLGHCLHAVDRRGVRVCLRVGDPGEIVGALANAASEVVLDRGYLRHQREWYDDLADRIDRRVTQIETEVVVPTAVASDHLETGARTIRPKINDRRNDFLVELTTTALDVRTTPQGTTSHFSLDELADDDAVATVIDRLGIAPEPGPVTDWSPGTSGARATLAAFIEAVASGDGYDAMRNRYTNSTGTSHLSPYLHFGQISPVHVANEVIARLGDEAEPFLEELIVRRELAVNFVQHCDDYDAYAGLPDWARTSLDEHRHDEREHVYTAAELEAAETHDDVWNAIMREIRESGWVHNQLRMYWGKQIVNWTDTPEHAFRTLLDINNRWFLDGRDPNSYTNVAWCFGRHDQGFKEREVSGKLRPFTTAALKRKDDLAGWIDEHSPTD